jgi:hypothetical protein
VSTHLGADEARDLASLVLLTSLARLLDYPDVDFVLDYYYKLSEGPKVRFTRSFTPARQSTL